MEHNFTSNHKYLENSTFSFTCNVRGLRLLISAVLHLYQIISKLPLRNFKLHLHLSRSQRPLGRHGRCNPLPPFYFVFSFSYGVAKLQPSPFSDIFLPTLTFVAPFFSLLALFLVKSSWQALMILIYSPTTLTCVSLLWLRYHHRANGLPDSVSDCIVSDVISL